MLRSPTQTQVGSMSVPQVGVLLFCLHHLTHFSSSEGKMQGATFGIPLCPALHNSAACTGFDFDLSQVTEELGAVAEVLFISPDYTSHLHRACCDNSDMKAMPCAF